MPDISDTFLTNICMFANIKCATSDMHLLNIKMSSLLCLRVRFVKCHTDLIQIFYRHLWKCFWNIAWIFVESPQDSQYFANVCGLFLTKLPILVADFKQTSNKVKMSTLIASWKTFNKHFANNSNEYCQYWLGQYLAKIWYKH